MNSTPGTPEALTQHEIEMMYDHCAVVLGGEAYEKIRPYLCRIGATIATQAKELAGLENEVSLLKLDLDGKEVALAEARNDALGQSANIARDMIIEDDWTDRTATHNDCAREIQEAILALANKATPTGAT